MKTAVPERVVFRSSTLGVLGDGMNQENSQLLQSRAGETDRLSIQGVPRHSSYSAYGWCSAWAR